ncbi:MAG TPA: hypothetical protein VF438_03215 [Candidatus Paceibacterota bacterium]
MASEEGGGGGGLVEVFFATMWDLLSSLVVGIFNILKKVIPFVLWVLLAIIVLPCVWVASEVYPKWVSWGEEF